MLKFSNPVNDEQEVAIRHLRRTRAANEETILVLRAQNDALDRVLLQLESGTLSPAAAGRAPEPERRPELPLDQREADEILGRLELLNPDKYPVETLKGKSRIEIAKLIAENFGGYLSPGALRKVFDRPGVLRGTKQVASVASRVLSESQEFSRVWAGLYRLTSPVQGAKQ